MLQAWGISEKGSVRPTNQDYFALDEALQLCVVADGVGGHRAGDVAARTAVDVLLDVVRNPPADGNPFGSDPLLSTAGNLIRTAIHYANVEVVALAARSTELAGMGTTIVAALVADGRLSVGHIGDSRLYRLTRGRLRQVTGDDSLATLMAADRGVDGAQLRHHPLRHVLTNMVGSRRPTDVHIVEEPIAPGDRFLMTTDGIHGVLEVDDLERLLAASEDGATEVAEIVRTALAQGSRDNCTAVVARYSA